jgi:dCMP deaminase
MEDLKALFDEAYENGKLLTTCIKVAVGAMFVTNSGKKIFAGNCNRDEGCNCQLNGECYKFKATGIYESCEETRKFCKAKHAEINLIEEVKWHKRPAINTSDGTVYVTRYPCLGCTKALIEAGFKRILYCGKQEISEEAAWLFSDAGVYIEHHPEFDYENGLKDTWWSDIFYEKAYRILTANTPYNESCKVNGHDRRIPFTIISYNNPSIPTLSRFHAETMTPELNWPILVFVRDSQKEIYEDATKQYKYCRIISFPDEVINNAGAVRRTALKWMYSQGYPLAFQLDDDVNLLTYGTLGRKADGWPKSFDVKNTNMCKVLAMWQIAMERAAKLDDVMLSGGMPIAFSWKKEYCKSATSYSVGRGSLTQVVCQNVKGLFEAGLFYKNNAEVGLDDIDMTARILESGHQVCTFSWLIYGCDDMGAPGQTLESLQARFQSSQDKLRALHGDQPWMTFRDKRNLPQACINWNGVRKMQRERGILKSEKYETDMWNGGRLLREAFDQSYER